MTRAGVLRHVVLALAVTTVWLEFLGQLTSRMGFLLLVTIVVLFPSGRAQTRATRLLLVVGAVLGGCHLVGLPVDSAPLDITGAISPLAAPALRAFVGLVASVTRLLPGTSDAFAVAAATLAAAALFQPRLTRVQRLVDRRFNRSRYDAQETVESFAGRLRHDVDPDDVRSELLGALESTLQPARLALRLRSASMTAGER